MVKQILDFLRDEEGASAVEYGLIVGLIAVLLVFTLGQLGGGLNGLFGTVSDSVTDAAGTSGGGTTPN